MRRHGARLTSNFRFHLISLSPSLGKASPQNFIDKTNSDNMDTTNNVEERTATEMALEWCVCTEASSLSLLCPIQCILCDHWLPFLSGEGGGIILEGDGDGSLVKN